MVDKRGMLGVALLVLSAFTGAYMLGYTPIPCSGNITDSYCSGDTQVKQSCVNGLIRQEKAGCGVCRDGACLPRECDAGADNVESVCGGFKRLVTYSCVEGGYDFYNQPCPEGMACVDGECVESSYDEDWALSSWSRYDEAVSGKPEFDPYLECAGVFDCNNILVSQLVDEINEKYKPSNPKAFINAASRHVNEMISYEYSGGASQCGEKASDLISKYQSNLFVRGNCVDYSTVMVAVLRDNGVPARQVAGCVDVSGFCNRLAITPQELKLGLGVCGDGVCGPRENERLCPVDCGEALASEGYAHAWLEAYTPELGFQVVDPTVDTGLASCVGYDRKDDSGLLQRQQCYLPVGVSC